MPPNSDSEETHEDSSAVIRPDGKGESSVVRSKTLLDDQPQFIPYTMASRFTVEKKVVSFEEKKVLIHTILFLITYKTSEKLIFNTFLLHSSGFCFFFCVNNNST